MAGAPTPPVLLEPIASQAGDSYITNPMPNTPTGTNAASVEQGFPPLDMQSILTGGQPPLGQDMNGFLYLVSSHTMYVQCGQPYLFSAEVAAAIGGYAIGTILGMADGSGLWVNLEAGNTNNPDTTVNGGWAPVYSNGTATIAMGSGANSLSPAEYAKSIIILNGALTANAILAFPEGFTGQWLIVNNTTGNFTVTAYTPAGGSTLIIPAGGRASPTGIASDGTNIFPNSTPLSVPIDQAATPLTLAERTNLGYIFAVYFNQSSGLEAPAIGSVFVQNTAGDGYLRKIALTNFESQMNLAGLGGQVVPAQVPFAAVSQWAAALFALSAFTSAVATFSGTAASGSIKLGVLIINFGTVTLTTDPQVIDFHSPYQTACYAIVPTGIVSTDSNIPILGISNPNVSPSMFSIYSSITGSGDTTINWASIGI